MKHLLIVFTAYMHMNSPAHAVDYVNCWAQLNRASVALDQMITGTQTLGIPIKLEVSRELGKKQASKTFVFEGQMPEYESYQLNLKIKVSETGSTWKKDTPRIWLTYDVREVSSGKVLAAAEGDSDSIKSLTLYKRLVNKGEPTLFLATKNPVLYQTLHDSTDRKLRNMLKIDYYKAKAYAVTAGLVDKAAMDRITVSCGWGLPN